MKEIIFVISLIAVLLLRSPTATNYYFANGGNDGGPGTIGAPYSNSASKINAVLAETVAGDHLLFNRGDSFPASLTGAVASGVTLEAYGAGARPVFYGLTALSSWTETSPGSHLWEAACSAGAHLDLVTMAGVTVACGRTPNTGSYFNIDAHSNVSGGYGTLACNAAGVGVQNWIGADIVIRVNQFNLDRVRVVSHVSFTFTYATPDNPKSISDNGNKFFVQNHPATLDVPNEWFYNPTTQVLRMYSTVNPSTLNVKAATKDFFFNQSYKNNLVFQDLKIVGFDSVGFGGDHLVGLNVNHTSLEDIGTEGFRLDWDSLCVLTDNDFNRMGSVGVDCRNSTKLSILNSSFDSCGLIRGMILPNNQQASAVLVVTYDNGVSRGNNTIVRHNTITNMGYMGISANGPGFHLDSNFISNIGLVLSDGGGVYTNNINDNPSQRSMNNNIILNAYGSQEMFVGGGPPHGMVGVYIDDGAWQVDALNNGVSNVSRAGIYMHNTGQINVRANNLFLPEGAIGLSTADDPNEGPVRQLAVSGNFVYTVPAKSVELSSIVEDYSAQGVFTANFFAATAQTTPFTAYGPNGNYYSLANWQTTMGYEAASSIRQVIADSMRFVYNATTAPVTTTLGATYQDLAGTTYPGSITLAAYASAILRKTANAPPTENSTYYLIEKKGKTFNIKTN